MFDSTTFSWLTWINQVPFAFYSDLHLRLVGSNLPYAGRVEVQYAGAWGVICPRRMNSTVFQVICRQLGFEGVMGDGRFYTNFEYPRRRYPRLYGDDAMGPVWLSKVYCHGNESKLSQCKIDSPGEILWCGHDEALELMCRPRNYTTRKLAYWTDRTACRASREFTARFHNSVLTRVFYKISQKWFAGCWFIGKVVNNNLSTNFNWEMGQKPKCFLSITKNLKVVVLHFSF